MKKAQAILEYLLIITFIVIAIILSARNVLMPAVARVYGAGLLGMEDAASDKRNTDLKNGEGHDVSRDPGSYPSSWHD